VFVGRVGLLTPVMPVGREGKATIYALLEEDVTVE
jgi:hypothetical protein